MPTPSLKRTLAWSALLIACWPVPALADVFHGSAGNLLFHAPRVAKGPVVDGRLDDPVWTQAAVLDSFVQRDPLEGVRDSLGTVCLVLYDEQNLYVGFRCADRSRDIRAPIVNRDKVMDGDWVAVALDTYHDRRTAFLFIANPHGIQADAVDQPGSDTDFSPDFIFTSKGHLTDSGYEVEMAIPFKSLRFSPSDTLSFGFDAARNVERNSSLTFWAPITRNKNSFGDQFGTLGGLVGVHPGRNLQVIPSFTSSRLGESGDGGFAYANENRLGASALYGLTTGLSANLTVTPDFSQVEADAGVLDINQRFAIYFDEKRPFFLEGNGIFKTPVQVVYTRRIEDPLYGVKITGKQGATSIGVLQASDRSAGDPVETLPDSANPYSGHNASFTLARFKRDVFSNSSVGLLLTDRHQLEAYCRDLSADAGFNFREHYNLSLQRVQSWARERDYRGAIAGLSSGDAAGLDAALADRVGAITTGDATRAQLNRSTKILELGGSVLDVSPQFAADMGFIPRTDVMDFGSWVNGHVFPAKTTWFNAFNPHLFYGRTYDHAPDRQPGRVTDSDLNPELQWDLPHGSWFGFGGDWQFTYFNGREFPDQRTGYVYAGWNRIAALRVRGNFGFGDGVIYDETVPGRGRHWQAVVTARPNPQLEAELSGNGSELERNETGARFADQFIPRLRVLYLFTPQWSLRWISELQRVHHYDTTGELSSQDRDLSLDLLASYQTGPGTVFYAGVGSRLHGDTEADLKPASSSVFIKLSYLFAL
ncbi:MAG: carbohydrate binding family 9 domain-containing protein [Candidatus Eisenbacteria bacterium]|nr:carbohydrate binding family 9 domain-containing protein [Candidatus Eisenbacteria bacterium]